jgi:hypothetical protein
MRSLSHRDLLTERSRLNVLEGRTVGSWAEIGDSTKLGCCAAADTFVRGGPLDGACAGGRRPRRPRAGDDLPVITGRTGLSPIFERAADFDLELIEHGSSTAGPRN